MFRPEYTCERKHTILRSEKKDTERNSISKSCAEGTFLFLRKFIIGDEIKKKLLKDMHHNESILNLNQHEINFL